MAYDFEVEIAELAELLLRGRTAFGRWNREREAADEEEEDEDGLDRGTESVEEFGRTTEDFVGDGEGEVRVVADEIGSSFDNSCFTC